MQCKLEMAQMNGMQKSTRQKQQRQTFRAAESAKTKQHRKPGTAHNGAYEQFRLVAP